MASFRDKRNVLVLSACQATFNSARGLTFLAATLASANMLGDDLTFVTVPLTMMVIGTAAGTLPAAHLMRRIGRKGGFVIGSLIGGAGGAMAILALVIDSFALFNAGLFLFGLYSGSAQQYRFAVADAAPEDFRAKAISLVLAAGVVGAFIGPETAMLTRNAVGSVEFLGTFMALIGFTLLTGLIVLGIDIPRLTDEEYETTGRPLSEIMVHPTFIVAVVAAMLGYMVMNLLMTATPIAMRVGSGHHFNDTAFVIEWHVVGMFAPGFFTGHLIKKFGVLRIIAAGGLLSIVAVAAALGGTTVTHFWLAMFFLGIGWNFSFTGGTTLLTEVYTPSERAKVQGVNDFIVFSGMAVSSLFSGTLYHFLGWTWVSLAALPMIATILIAVTWLSWHRNRQHLEPVPITETTSDGL